MFQFTDSQLFKPVQARLHSFIIVFTHSLHFSSRRAVFSQCSFNGNQAQPTMSIACNDEPRLRVVELDCKKTFESLTSTEKLYAHHTARAFFEGALVLLLQMSRVSAGMFILLYRLFSSESIENLKQKAYNVGLTELEWKLFIDWSAHARLWKLVASSAAASIFPDLLKLYESIERAIFSRNPMPALGFPSPAMQAKNPQLITKQRYNLCNAIVKRLGLMRSNTRFCREEVDGENVLKIKVASTKPETIDDLISDGSVGEKVRVEKGHYTEILSEMCQHLSKAKEYSATEKQRQMLENCIKYFETAEYSKYMNYDSLWIENIQPVVTSLFYFAENTRRPPGNRSEFVGFVAALNREKYDKCSLLVNSAASILKKLPWGNAFEKNQFLKPDFAQLDVMAFSFEGNRTIKGHNFAPFPSDVMSNSMGRCYVYSNIISALPVSMNYIKDEDKALLLEYNGTSNDLQTSLHELLGHGSGKLLVEDSNGKFNFDRSTTKDPLTGEMVNSWYKPGQNYLTVFGELDRAYEECRAMAVSLTLSCDTEVLEMMGHHADKGQDVKYIAWLIQMRDGLLALQAYNVIRGIWLNIHARACFVLMKVVLEAGEGCLSIEQVKNSSGKDDLIVNLNRDKIDTVGLPAVRQFLLKLQTYKSTANVKAARDLFDKYSVMGPKEMNWRRIREEKRTVEPRLLFLQPNTQVKDGQVQLVTYPETPEGVIRSVIDRYSPESVKNLEKIWTAEQQKQ